LPLLTEDQGCRLNIPEENLLSQPLKVTDQSDTADSQKQNPKALKQKSPLSPLPH